MRKPLLILTPVLCFLMIAACSKSGSNNGPQGIEGTWIVLGDTVQARTVVNEGAGVTLVAYPVFFTKNNVGTLTFAKDSMKATGLGYTVDTAFWAYFYYNGSLYDSSRQAMSYTVPPTSNTAKYNLIGTDSIYFPSGGMLTVLDSSSTGQGCTYIMKGDSLLLTTAGVDSSSGTKTTYLAKIALKRSK